MLHVCRAMRVDQETVILWEDEVAGSNPVGGESFRSSVARARKPVPYKNIRVVSSASKARVDRETVTYPKGVVGGSNPSPTMVSDSSAVERENPFFKLTSVLSFSGPGRLFSCGSSPFGFRIGKEPVRVVRVQVPTRCMLRRVSRQPRKGQPMAPSSTLSFVRYRGSTSAGYLEN